MNAHLLRRHALAGASLLMLIGLSGCVLAPVHPMQGAIGGDPYYGAPQMVAPMAPPPLIVEHYGVAPVPGYLWINGHWGWSGSQYAWNRGHWVAPRPGYRYAPHRWTPMRGGGWGQHGGRWHR